MNSEVLIGLITLLGIWISSSILGFFHLDKKIEGVKDLLFKIGIKIGAIDTPEKPDILDEK